MTREFSVRGRESVLSSLGGESTSRGDVQGAPDDRRHASETESAPYVILEELASDERALVYRARDLDLGREVELRVLRSDSAGCDEAREGFAREALLSAQIQHQSVPVIYELGQGLEGVPFRASELVHGDSFQCLLTGREGRGITLVRGLTILEHVAQAIAAAHGCGIAHTALSAEAVRVGRHGEVKVKGWEQARRFDPASPSAEDALADLSALGQMLIQVVELGRGASVPPEAAHPTSSTDVQVQVDAEVRELLDLASRVGQHDGSPDELTAHRLATDLASWLVSSQRRVAVSEEAAARAMTEAHGTHRRKSLAIATVVLLVAGITAGGVAWTWQAEREHAREELAMRDIEPLLRAGLEAAARARASLADALVLWERASAAARGASELVTLRGATDALRAQIEALVEECRLGLREARDRADLQARRDGWLAELRAVRLETFRTWSFRAADERYASLFRAIGLDPAIPFSEVVERLRATGFAGELVEALDAWWDARQEFDREGAAPLLALANAIDPDAKRREVRKAVRARAEALQLARALDCKDVSPATIALFARALTLHGDIAVAIEVLERGVAAHPDDVWLHLDLSKAALEFANPKRIDVGLRHAWAAFALRPTDRVAHHQLCLAWAEAGETERAIEGLRRASERDGRSIDTYLDLSLCLEMAGDWEASEYMAREALTFFPNSVELRVNRSIALERLGRFEEALQLAREAVSMEPQHIQALTTLGAQLANRFARLDEAEECFLGVLDSNPHDLHALFNLTLVARRRGDPDAAARWAQHALEHGEWPALRVMLGEIELERGRNEAAATHFERGMQADDSNPQYVAGLGEVRVRQGRLDEARVLFEKACGLAPGEARSWRRLAELERDGGEPERALETLDRGFVHCPGSASLHELRGLLLESAFGKPAEALEAYRRGIACERDSSQLACTLMAAGVSIDLQRFREARELLQHAETYPAHGAETIGMVGELYCAARDLEAGRRLLERGVDERSTRPKTWWMLAGVRIQAGDTSRVGSLLEEALSRFPNDWELHARAGYLLSQRLDAEARGREVLARAVALDPNDGESWFYLGEAHGRLREFDQAIGAWRRAEALLPDQAAIQVNLSRVHLLRNQLEAARVCCQRVLERDPENALATGNLGLTLWMLGELEPAAEQFERSVSRMGGDASTWLSLAQVCLALGRWERAREAFERAEALGLDDALLEELRRDVDDLNGLYAQDAVWKETVAGERPVPDGARERWQLARVARRAGDARFALDRCVELLAADALHALDPLDVRLLAECAALEVARGASSPEEREELCARVIGWLETDLETLRAREPALARQRLEGRRRAPSLEFLRDPNALQVLAPGQLEAGRALASRLDGELRSLRVELEDVEPTTDGR